jgi:golgi-associated PDZ and coiled-coil motif-containing protein
MRSDLVEARAFKRASEKELEKLIIELQTSQLKQISPTKTKEQKVEKRQDEEQEEEQDETTPTNNNTNMIDLIQKRLQNELTKRFDAKNDHYLMCNLQEELKIYKKENEKLREDAVNLKSEIYGSRLAAKYLDKELAGRIQQIQLFGKNLKSEEHERLWNQIEAEIHLHRHKTVIKACRSRQNIKSSPSKNEAQKQEEEEDEEEENDLNPIDSNHDINQRINKLRNKKRDNKLDQVRKVNLIRKNDGEGLGISITGGKDHGVPILISEIHPNGPAYRSSELFVGDAILSVNGINLRESFHSEAVKILSNLVS